MRRVQPRGIAQIADELYRLDPAAFTAARNERAKDVGGELGKRVRLLRKPSVAAWMTNLLAQERVGELDEAIALGDAIRDAQDEGDRDRIVSLGAQRRERVAALAARAGELAAARGYEGGQAALAEVSTTLQAAIFDPQAAAAVRSGRLLRSLESGGLDGAELAEIAAVPEKITVTAAPTRSARRRSASDVSRLRRQAEEAEGLDAETAAAQKAIDRKVESVSRRAERIADELKELEAAARAKRDERDEVAETLAAVRREAARLRTDARTAHGDAVRARRLADTAN